MVASRCSSVTCAAAGETASTAPVTTTKACQPWAFDIVASHLLHAVWHLLHVHAARGRGGPLRAHTLDIERELHLACLFEVEGDRHLVALLERTFQVEHHQMISAGCELHRLAGFDGQAVVERPHRHDA